MWGQRNALTEHQIQYYCDYFVKFTWSDRRWATAALLTFPKSSRSKKTTLLLDLEPTPPKVATVFTRDEQPSDNRVIYRWYRGRAVLRDLIQIGTNLTVILPREREEHRPPSKIISLARKWRSFRWNCGPGLLSLLPAGVSQQLQTHSKFIFRFPRCGYSFMAHNNVKY